MVGKVVVAVGWRWWVWYAKCGLLGGACGAPSIYRVAHNKMQSECTARHIKCTMVGLHAARSGVVLARSNRRRAQSSGALPLF